MKFNKYKFRCSQLGKLMVNPKNQITEKQLEIIKKYEEKEKLTDKQAQELERLIEKRENAPKLSETTKGYLLEVFIEEVYGRSKDISSKAIEKGNYSEELSIDLISDLKGQLMIKNEERLENEYITGTPDIVSPELRDVKTCWDIHTFAKKEAGSSKLYEWQLFGYMWLTGSERALLDYTLVNAPEHMIVAEKSRRVWQDGLSDGSEEMLAMEAEVDLSMTFDDIDKEVRLKEFEYAFDESKIDLLIERIEYSREYLNNLSL